MQRATPFALTFARMMADQGWSTVLLASAGAAVLLMWCWWAGHAELTLYEVSLAARVELDAATYPVQSPVSGRIVKSALLVGDAQAVHRGDILIELDSALEELRVREQQVRVATVEPELVRLRSQVAAEERARTAEQRAARSSADEAVSRLRAAKASVQYADSSLARMQALYEKSLISRHEVDRAKVEAEQLGAVAAALDTAVRRVQQEQATRERDRDARIEGLRAQIVARDAERRALTASVERLQYEIERRRIRAPVDGIVGESAVLRPGGVVEESAHLASIVSAGRLVISAQVPAGAALGRIRPGQPAVLRLQGFPWTEFGSVSATVAHVARELRNGSVRVELSIDPTSRFRGPLEHGMPGALEIAVERITPLALLLRTLGQALTAPR